MGIDAAKFWDEHVADKKRYIRSYGEGVGTASRDWLLTVIRDGESLLDVGCGPGCTYENLKVHKRDVEYLGLDISPGFVEACRELFPEGDFHQGDAMRLDEDGGSWDTVLLRHLLSHTPEYQAPIAEALRVARKRVVIVMWRPLSDKPSTDRTPEANDYNATEFLGYVHSFLLPVRTETFGGGRPNWAWVIYKALDDCVFDLDDLHDDAPNVELLHELKAKFPALKVTLFGIPAKMKLGGPAQELGRLDWVELAAHGWHHEDNWECTYWTHQECKQYLDRIEAMGCFVQGFRPPGWRIGDALLDELAVRGYWVALHKRDWKRAWVRGLRNFQAHGNHLSVHGHFQDNKQRKPLLRNGLRQLIEERGLPWDQGTQFHFISEVLDGADT